MTLMGRLIPVKHLSLPYTGGIDGVDTLLVSFNLICLINTQAKFKLFLLA